MRIRIALGVLTKLGSRITKYLNEKEEVEIIAVDPSDTDREGQYTCHKDIKQMGLPLKSYKEIVNLQPDIFISVSYLKKIGPELFENCLSINLHVAKIPEYRGRNPYTHAIQNNEKYYYTTLLKIDEGYDTGDIICEEKERIRFRDTSKSLFDRMEEVSYHMFINNFDNILNGTYTLKKQKNKGTYYSKELRKQFDLNDKPLEVYNKIRSLDFPPYEPAYYFYRNKKYHVRFKDVVYNRDLNILIIKKDEYRVLRG